jgi:hypothetical protein
VIVCLGIKSEVVQIVENAPPHFLIGRAAERMGRFVAEESDQALKGTLGRKNLSRSVGGNDGRGLATLSDKEAKAHHHREHEGRRAPAGIRDGRGVESLVGAHEEE